MPRHVESRGMWKNYRRRRSNPSLTVNGEGKADNEGRIKKKKIRRKVAQIATENEEGRKNKIRCCAQGREAEARDDASSVKK